MSHKLTTCFLAMLLALGPAFPGIQWVIFGASMAVCAVICVMVFRLEKHRCLKWLRYAY